MEISDNSMAMFYMSKILGLAPFSVRKNSKNVSEYQHSIFFTIYSLSLLIIMVFLTYLVHLSDGNSKIPVRASLTTNSATSKVVTALDVSVVVLATTAGVFCGIFGLGATRDLNQRLRKIDDILNSSAYMKGDRKRTLAILIVPFVFISILLALDSWTWIRFAENLKTDKSKTELKIQWYLPFYSLYIILTGLHITISNTSYGLGLRFSRLNQMLRSSFLPATKMDAVPTQNITTVRSFLRMSNSLRAEELRQTELISDLHGHGENKKKALLLKLLSESHESLGKCLSIAASSFGLAVVFILVSCLLHLVATAYFLFLELFSNKDNGYVWLQILWTLFHTFRLLLLVEPCHFATRESKRTIQIICEIERKVHDPILVEEVKKFWQQLLVLDSEYSACGLCRVDRNILSLFSSAIATYLVILIQFQKSNG